MAGLEVTGATRLVAHPASAPLLPELLSAEVAALTAAASASPMPAGAAARMAALAHVPVSLQLLSGGLGKEVRALKKVGGDFGQAAGQVVDAWKSRVMAKP